ncbi:RecF/RecN/SMC N terminal domain-containing protein [Methylophilus rhizosphaerae]|uniref:RecF/RecN/SMC N terminal domain-containing protein n=1 Tax=Methylophilus rhizosphaerae TaxID=492660 RepID=A0A1G8ZNT9_9PROT|nr:AAA family ATPase [Methylophilus rhizosphaerae]SDK16254.1 RecF/RecN/SMC N terminal domain-containing protein [Methylophilus rhizosphaerae]
MFRLTNLEVVNWDYWQRFTVPLDASIVTIVGPNGSGKTTLLDALRTLLALDCSKKRDYKRYVRRNGESFAWLRGVVDNSRPINSSKRPFGILYNNDQITLACRIDKKGGDWERKYWIAEGEVAIEQIEAQGQMFGVKDFQRQLHAAGLSPAIAKVLSLEQGQTDKLCELSERELLKLVFEVFGDEEVLTRYQEARHHQEQTVRELQDTENNLRAQENHLQAMETRVNRYLEWQNLNQERTLLISEFKPRLAFYTLSEEAERARNTLKASRRDLLLKRQERIAHIQQQSQKQQEMASLVTRKELADTLETKVNQQLNHINEEIGGWKKVVEQQDLLLKQAGEAGADSAEEAVKLNALEAKREALRQQLVAINTQETQLKDTLENLASGKRAEPMDVANFRSALDKAGIGHDLLTDLVEITDTRWQAAVEAVLASSAHIVLLADKKDEARALSLGEQLKYRHYIVPERAQPPLAPKGSLLEVVKFSRDVPEWVSRVLAGITRVEDANAGASLPRNQDWVTRQGYLRERRGARFAAPEQPRFGRARLEALRTQLAEIERQSRDLLDRLKPVNADIQVIKARLAGVNATMQLASRSAEFAEARAQYDILVAQRREIGEQSYEATEARKALEKQLSDARTEQLGYTTRLKELDRDIAEKENHDGRAEQARRLIRLRHDKRQLPLTWQDANSNKQLAEKWESVKLIEIKAEEIERRFETESWEKDDSVVVLRNKIKADYEAQSQDLDNRRYANEMASKQTDAARKQYVDVLKHTVGRYTKNLKVLGDMAGIAVEHEAVMFSADDVSLSQAGLVVRFGFDDKGLAGMNDGDASGGQQVMKSLILLVGLMMEDSRPGGFVFIDEPFAHLDIFNIKRVASFLQATKAQYLLTTPVTHNVNVYDPSMLTLVTRKKEPETHWAPRVGVLVRQQS